MSDLAPYLEEVVGWLQKLDGAPATLLVMIACWVIGYMLRYFKGFPNDGIPVAVVLFGGVVYPLIADANNDLPFRIWIIRNMLIGLIIGLAAWMLHKFVLSKVEDKLGIGKQDETKISTPTTPGN